MDDGDRFNHLQLIQQVVERMAANSFKLKEWTVAIVSAILTVSVSNIAKGEYVPLIATVSLALFWSLDAYYLAHERHYRDLYNKARDPKNAVDFSLTTEWQKCAWLRSMFSLTLFLFYGILLLLVALTFLGVKNGKTSVL